MKNKIKKVAIGLIILTVGFFTGGAIQHMRTGRYFDVRDSKNHESSLGVIEWSYVTDSIGIPFLDPGTTIIEFDDRIVYKADRIFQESYPVARNLEVSNGNIIQWDDGEYLFRLKVDKLPKEKEPE